MTETAQLRDTIDQLNTELNETKVELRDTKRKLLQARTNESQKIKDWKRTTESLEARSDSQKDEIEHLENTLNCFLNELTDMTPETAIEGHDESRQEQERVKKRLENLSAELEQYKNMWRVEEKRSEDLEEALFQATMDEDELRAKLEEIEMGGSTTKSFLKNGQSLEPIEEHLLQETQAELETTTDDVKEAKSELAFTVSVLQDTNEELKQSKIKLEVTLDEKKFLESKAEKVYRIPFLKPIGGFPMVIEDRRIPEHSPGRVRMEYQGDEVWKCSHLKAVEKLRASVSQKNKDIITVRHKHRNALNILEQTVQDQNAQILQTLRRNLNRTLQGTNCLYNERLTDLNALNQENIMLREELNESQGWIKIVKSDSRGIKTAKVMTSSEEILENSKRSLTLKKPTGRNKCENEARRLRVEPHIISLSKETCDARVLVSRVI